MTNVELETVLLHTIMSVCSLAEPEQVLTILPNLMSHLTSIYAQRRPDVLVRKITCPYCGNTDDGYDLNCPTCRGNGMWYEEE